MAGDQGWRALADHVRRERHRRRQTQAQFARSLGISARLVTDLETAARTNYDDGTRSIIEDALGWTPGDFDRVVTGQGPNARADPFDGYPMLTRIADVWGRISPEGRELLAQLAEYMGS